VEYGSWFVSLSANAYAGGWLAEVMGRRRWNVVAVVQDNKSARIVRALLGRERDYELYNGSAA
jgi:hypothetical protein